MRTRALVVEIAIVLRSENTSVGQFDLHAGVLPQFSKLLRGELRLRLDLAAQNSAIGKALKDARFAIDAKQLRGRELVGVTAGTGAIGYRRLRSHFFAISALRGGPSLSLDFPERLLDMAAA